MAQEIKDIKKFIELARRKDVKSAIVKKNATSTKFKVRGSRHLYTLVLKDKEKAQKLIHSLPPNLTRTEITTKVPKKSN
uniref:Large ribosomal subunit protein eL38 n=1 Tax=Blastobotrys adeninivorans TaxID=409370 RepID=A0A060TIU8_BLAAD